MCSYHFQQCRNVWCTDGLYSRSLWILSPNCKTNHCRKVHPNWHPQEKSIRCLTIQLSHNASLQKMIVLNRIFYRSPMLTEKSQLEGKWVIPETRVNEFPELSVYPRVGTSRYPESGDFIISWSSIGQNNIVISIFLCIRYFFFYNLRWMTAKSECQLFFHYVT